MFPREVISAGSLVLRPPVAADVDAIMRACDDPVTARYLPVLPRPYTLADAHEYLQQAGLRWAEGGTEYSITENGHYVGAIGIKPPDSWGVAEIGYLVAPWARGKGVASSAARMLTQWLFDKGIHRVELQAEVENTASIRAALKAGFREEGRRREAKALRDGTRTDLITFGALGHDPMEAAESYLPFFEGGRLTDGVVALTPLAAEDAGEYHRMMVEPSVAAFGLGGLLTLDEDVRRMRYTGYWWVTGQRVELAIRDAASGAFAGHLQLTQITPVLAQGMIGYSLLPEFRGLGFMTRAVRLLADWAFAKTPLHRVIAGTDAGNLASQHVLERAGFERECLHRELLPHEDGTRGDEVSWVRIRPS
jgi:RimJ/RimL family protein N-acetyltransferase